MHNFCSFTKLTSPMTTCHHCRHVRHRCNKPKWLHALRTLTKVIAFGGVPSYCIQRKQFRPLASAGWVYPLINVCKNNPDLLDPTFVGHILQSMHSKRQSWIQILSRVFFCFQKYTAFGIHDHQSIAKHDTVFISLWLAISSWSYVIMPQACQIQV